MNNYPATPAEYEQLTEQLEPLREDMRRRRPPMTEDEISKRMAGIARMMFEEVATCPTCDQAVRRSDPRRLVDGELVHISCAERWGGG